MKRGQPCGDKPGPLAPQPFSEKKAENNSAGRSKKRDKDAGGFKPDSKTIEEACEKRIERRPIGIKGFLPVPGRKKAGDVSVVSAVRIDHFVMNKKNRPDGYAHDEKDKDISPGSLDRGQG